MSTIAIMQPYFFPYLGYIGLIKHTDRFILFDEVQFIRHGWIERNRILKPDSGWQYIQIPLEKHHQNTLIKDIHINNTITWKEKIIAQLQHYKKKAPYYYATINLLKEIFADDFTDITVFNQIALKKVLEFLRIDKKIEIFSQMDLPIDSVNAPDEWALNICKALGDINEYWNPPGGKTFFNPQKYEDAGISLRFYSINIKEYDQKREVFESGLSILDVLMFNSIEEINNMLDDYEFL